MTKYSNTLGVISDEQFQKALDKFNLGQFVKAEKIPYGIVGQNVFLTSSKGEFVLRGNPFYPHQFDVERFMVDNLRKRTNIRVAYPYLIDKSADIFGWTYAIMPKLPGIQVADGGRIIIQVDKGDRLKIAHAMGENLAEMQKFTFDYPGYHTDENTISPFTPSYPDRIIRRIETQLEKLPEISNITDEDIAYVNNILKENRNSLYVPFQPCFVMGDYKEDNVVVSHNDTDGKWSVCGVFDFAMSHFGDGEADVSRLYAMYIDEDADLAKEFISTYMQCKPPHEGFFKRLKIYNLDERIGIWEWAKRAKIVWWDDSTSLRDWLVPYLDFEFL